MAWLYLALAGIFEIIWAVGLKYSEGFTRFWISLGTIGAIFASLGLLGLALRSLPLGTSYAVWTGIGTVGTALLGMVLFGENSDPLRLGCILLVVVGIVGLKLIPS